MAVVVTMYETVYLERFFGCGGADRICCIAVSRSSRVVVGAVWFQDQARVRRFASGQWRPSLKCC